MALGNEIIVSTDSRGRRVEGIIDGTPKPGTIMQIKAATEPIGGRFTYEVYDADADGNQRAICVLLADSLQGKTATQAYVDEDRCFLYYPMMGDELNVLVTAAGTGTGDSVAIGDLLIVEDGTGLCIATSSGEESEPFQVLETDADLPSAGELIHVLYTGY